MCCHLTRIPVLAKNAGDWCVHCSTHQRCDIYESRPAPCREFFCVYRLNPTLSEEWHPIRAHLMITAQESPYGHMVVAMVDPQYPDIWRQEPYITRFRRWSAQFQMVIAIGARRIMVFPDHEKDLGDLPEDAQIELITIATPTGMQKTARVKPAD